MPHAAHPLFPTQEKAIVAPGTLYTHYKGGIYRLLSDSVIHGTTGEVGMFYEHLWPNTHGYFWRPKSVWDSPTTDGEKRFRPLRQTPYAAPKLFRIAEQILRREIAPRVLHTEDQSFGAVVFKRSKGGAPRLYFYPKGSEPR